LARRRSDRARSGEGRVGGLPDIGSGCPTLTRFDPIREVSDRGRPSDEFLVLKMGLIGIVACRLVLYTSESSWRPVDTPPGIGALLGQTGAGPVPPGSACHLLNVPVGALANDTVDRAAAIGGAGRRWMKFHGSPPVDLLLSTSVTSFLHRQPAVGAACNGSSPSPSGGECRAVPRIGTGGRDQATDHDREAADGWQHRPVMKLNGSRHSGRSLFHRHGACRAEVTQGWCDYRIAEANPLKPG